MPTAPPTSAERYVEFDEFVEFQLHKTESAIKTVDVLTAIVGASVVVVAYVLAFVVLDHWVVPGGFGYFARAAMLGAVVIAALAWVVWKVVIPIRRRVNTLYAARTIENSAPEAKSTLLNLVDLRRAGRPVPPQIMGTLEKRAALMLSHVDVEQTVDRRLLMRLAYALLIVVVGFCLYTLFSPKKVSNSIWRALFPAAQIDVATLTQIVGVEPGDVEVLPGAHLDVFADVAGKTPDKVTLYFSTADQRIVDERLEMLPVPEGGGRYRASLVGEAGRGIRQNMTYRVEAGDAHSATFRVTVQQPPSATVTGVAYEYPPYMNLQPRASDEPHIEGWEGTRVTLSATTNVPVEKAWIEFSDDEHFSRRGEEVTVREVSGSSLRHTWTLELRPIDVQPRSPRFYRIQVRTAKGERDPAPIVHPIHIRPDEPPQLRIVEPRTEEVAAAANAAIPLLAEARDDFAIRSVSLQFRHQGKVQPLDRALARHENTDLYGHVIELDKLLPFALKPGDLLEYRLEARDNKPELGQATFSEWRTIRIVEGLPPEEQKRQREAAREQQRQRLEEAQQEAGDGRPEQNQQQPGGQTEAGGEQPDAGQGEERGDPKDGQPRDGAQQNGGTPETRPGGAGDSGNQPQGAPEGAAPQPRQSEGAQPPAQREEPGRDAEKEPLKDNGEDDDAAIQRALNQLRRQIERGKEQSPQDQPGDGNPQAQPDERQKQPSPTGDPDGQSDQSPAPAESQGERPAPAGSEANRARGAGDQTPEGAAGERQPTNPNNTPAQGTPGENEPPSNPDAPASRGTASGREEGTATPDRDPDSNPVEAQKPLERTPGEDPHIRPGQPEERKLPENNRHEAGEPGAGQQTRSEPSGARQTRQEPTTDEAAGESPASPDSGSPRPGDPQGTGDRGKPEPGGTEGTPQQRSGPQQGTENETGRQAGERGQPAGEPNRQPAGTEGASRGGAAGRREGTPEGEPGMGSGTGADGPKPEGPAGGGEGGSPGPESADGPPSGDSPHRSEDANLEYNRKAAEFVLRQLEDQLARGEVDEDLKKALGWNEEQIRNFIERNKPLLADEPPPESPDWRQRKNRLDEMLKSLNLTQPPETRTGQDVPRSAGEGFTPRQTPPPPEYRRQYEEYLRRINQGSP